MKKATIYHNPRCSKSREALAMLKEKQYEIEIVEYLKTPLDEQAIKQLLEEMNLSPRQLLRNNEAVYKELNLADQNVSDKELILAMVNNPRLINRPIVTTSKGTRLGRPIEQINEIIE